MEQSKESRALLHQKLWNLSSLGGSSQLCIIIIIVGTAFTMNIVLTLPIIINKPAGQCLEILKFDKALNGFA